ncbi:uncharacterized protein LOC128996110 isoform X2 [Macrosteles quadrilineatus]|uniref:uncharacterized protein LOC128996110 isoform X2 n=1 Tax=Macrosteles quadrilineatus TaxID=74068 RepID=UPI0023E0D74D|nr:uncharacterized protein LOC128996110 isoform X2 [Macrosteles quadrilineatus]
MEVTCTEFMYLFSTALVCVLTSVAGQGCLNQGNECFTHSACCGGCCRTGICVESGHRRLCELLSSQDELYLVPSARMYRMSHHTLL